ncbi:MAG: sulfotransferase [Myxococcota bacterium]|nr:sulfotransferase [Myxococcota bacterium]
MSSSPSSPSAPRGLAYQGLRAYANLAQAFSRRPRKFAETKNALLEEACQRTGLSDYGDRGFEEGLEILLKGYDEEAQLNVVGRLNVRQELLGVLSARLQLIEEWKSHPDAESQNPERPLFILGLPRTGTSALHDLLAEDPEHQVLEYWLAASPAPRPVQEISRSDPRLKAARRELQAIYTLDPGLRALHDMRAEGPEECRHLFRHNFIDDTFDSMANLPSYGEWFRAQSVSHIYDWHRKALSLVQLTAPNKRWVLKYPAHLRNLDELFDAYPDACIIQTHRNPVDVLPSLCSLVYRLRCLYSDHIDPHDIGRWQVEMWAGILERGMEIRKRHDPARFHDVYFTEFQRDPVKAVRSIHQHFGGHFDDQSASRIQRYRAENPPGRHGQHVYRAEDYGLTDQVIRERFSAYIEAFEMEERDRNPGV